jgi:hypothetical protein
VATRSLTRYEEVGIDMGLKTFAMLSDGHDIANPRFFGAEAKALTSAQRKHQIALDAHLAMRVEVTRRVKQAHPELDTWVFGRE